MIKTLFSTNPRSWGPVPIRLILAIVFIAHGSQKLFGSFGGPGLEATGQMFDKMGFHPGSLWAMLASGGEFFGGVLLLLGLATRLGALTLVCVMGVAVFHVHWGKFFLTAGGMEYALALLGCSISVLITGGGAMSIDSLIPGSKKVRQGQ